MIEPTDVVYYTADDRTLRPDELEAFIETEECAIELYRGTEPILSIADPRRFNARDVTARVRHPSADPADAFIEVQFRATLSLPRDRCQPVGATPPARPISTAKMEALEALRDSDGDAADEDSSQDAEGTVQTWESSDVTTESTGVAEEMEPHPTNGGGDADKTHNAATSADDHASPVASDSSDDEDDTKVVLRDGEFVEVPDDDAE